jgi:heme-degrading monooxygenase HmoA
MTNFVRLPIVDGHGRADRSPFRRTAAPVAYAEGFYEVKTWWRSMEDFVAWTRSEAFAEAHANRPPKEMFRGPSELDVHEVFLSTGGE